MSTTDYRWRTWGTSRVHHACLDEHGSEALCGLTGTTSVTAPGGAPTCLDCHRELMRLPAREVFGEVARSVAHRGRR